MRPDSAGPRPVGSASATGEGNALPWLWLTAVLIALDQLSKLWALSALTPYQSQPVLPFLNWTLVFNPGAAFSFLSDHDGWQRWLFTGLAAVVSVLLIYWLRQTPRGQRGIAIPYALILSGALGNLIDRVRYGHVVDFIDVHAAGWHFPAFNVADSAISVGAVLLIAGLLFGRREGGAG